VHRRHEGAAWPEQRAAEVEEVDEVGWSVGYEHLLEGHPDRPAIHLPQPQSELSHAEVPGRYARGSRRRGHEGQPQLREVVCDLVERPGERDGVAGDAGAAAGEECCE
jgi:hypothetical protein